MDNKRECAYKSGSGCLMKNKTFPLHDCDGVNNCRYEKMGKAPRPQDSSGSAEFALSGHEGCKLVAVLDGCGESAAWTLEVENQDGEIVAMIEWPEVFGDWQTEGELIKKGFECRVA